MSISDAKFKKVVSAIENVLKKEATNEAREIKDLRIQGFSLDSENIFNEISHSLSPFMLKGQELPQSDRQALAKKIADDLWNIYTTKINLGKVFTTGQETDFINFNSPAVLFNSVTRIMYIKGKPGSNHFKILQKANTKVRNFLNSRPLTNTTRVFWNPNEEYLKRKEGLEEKLREEYAKTGLASKHSISQKNKWFENRRKRNSEFKDLDAQFPQNTGGVEAGHVFGPAVTIATGLLEDRQDIRRDVEGVQVISVIPAKFKATVKEAILKVVSADAKIEYKRKSGFDSVLGLITVTVPELRTKNRQEGRAAQKRLNELKAIIRKLQPEIFEMRGSPSFKRLLSKLIEDKFLGRRVSSKTYVTKKRLKGKAKNIRVPIHRIKGGRVKTRVTTKSRTENRSTPTPNLKLLIAMLNRKLHDAIQNDMGKGSSRLRLNYRTGRFARSAEIQYLIPGKGKNNLIAQVRYMRDPYSVFEKTGHLFKPLRDPAGIFGRSIRRILQEQRIATLRKVEVKLRG